MNQPLSSAAALSATVATNEAAAAAPMLSVEGIVKRYGSNQVLNGIGLAAPRGGVISIIGSSGSGKSTLLRCINLLERPNAGRITLAGETLKLAARGDGMLDATDRAQLQRFRSRMVMVFQHFNLWSHMTVLQNLIEAPVRVLGQARAEVIERAEHYLQRVGLHHRRDYYPAHLSGGEQQRAAIARALVMEPEVMLFDEPTSALDPELVGEVLNVMRQIAIDGRTMLVVTHEMSFARDVSSEVVFLHQGRIEEQGAPQDVLGQPNSERLRKFLASALR
jgi:arginine/ornithine transport system ATP-binding protein